MLQCNNNNYTVHIVTFKKLEIASVGIFTAFMLGQVKILRCIQISRIFNILFYVNFCCKNGVIYPALTPLIDE